MKIVLTGFMGTGKTSVGKEVSRRLGYQFIDTDDLIEEHEGMPISLIFKEKGEDYFRAIEKNVVAQVSRKKKVVISTGGGVIKNKENVENLRKDGIIIWLKADPEIILRRIMLEGGKRPLLDVAEPLKEIKRLLMERERLYMQADVSINTNYISPGETAEEIIEKLGLDMSDVIVELKERSYKIIIGKDALHKIGFRVIGFRPSKIGVISNKTVFPLYGEALLKSLKEVGLTAEVFLIPDGEEYKDLLWASYLYGELLKARFDRDSLLIAFGGGVVGDITGFVASTYMRGIRYIQVPTTLLAQVDSSVGGKTGVNHPLGKNMIGTFYQPSLVLIDIDTLKSLSQREFVAGIAEIIKYGVIADGELFDLLQRNIEGVFSFDDILMKVIKRSCEIKANVVSRDEREAGLRAILNFGHTVGHALETVTGYKRFLHGEAVAIGMCVASQIAIDVEILNRGDAERIESLISLYKLPTKIPKDISLSDITEAMELDKKVRARRMRFVLPESIGKVRIEENVDIELLKGALEKMLDR